MSFQPSDDIIKIIICHLSLFWFGPIEPREYPARIYIITLLQLAISAGLHVKLPYRFKAFHYEGKCETFMVKTTPVTYRMTRILKAMHVFELNLFEI